VLRDQKPDGSWLLNPPARDRHATFDAMFCLTQLGKETPQVKKAMQKAAAWVLSCRNPDGGFGHFPGSPSDARRRVFSGGNSVHGRYPAAGSAAAQRPAASVVGSCVSKALTASKEWGQAPRRLGASPHSLDAD